MTKSTLTLATAKKIKRLLEGEKIPSSSFPSALASELKEENLLGMISHGSRVSYYLLNCDACRRYIENRYLGGNSIENWIECMGSSNESLERSTLINETGGSKSIDIRTFRGFLVNSYEPLEVAMGERSFILSPEEHTAIFIQDPDHFTIPEDVIVVGVENGENFREIRRQRYLFESHKVLFVSRYPQSTDLRNWLCSIPNRYLHFGDFDLAGIHIFLTEFYKHLGDRASFFIPADIESRIRKGNSKLYDEQYAKFNRMKVSDARLLPLVNMIHKYHRVYEQEGYIQKREL